jgi:hypothetical protein
MDKNLYLNNDETRCSFILFNNLRNYYKIS